MYSGSRWGGSYNLLEGETDAQRELGPATTRDIRNDTERRKRGRTTQEYKQGLTKQESCWEVIAAPPEMVLHMAATIAPECPWVTDGVSSSCSLSSPLNNLIQISHVRGHKVKSSRLAHCFLFPQRIPNASSLQATLHQCYDRMTKYILHRYARTIPCWEKHTQGERVLSV